MEGEEERDEGRGDVGMKGLRPLERGGVVAAGR